MALGAPNKPTMADKQKGLMQVQREFDILTANTLESMPIEEIRKKLGIEELQAKQNKNSHNLTWGERAMKEIEQLNISEKTWEQINRDREEFRNDEGA